MTVTGLILAIVLLVVAAWGLCYIIKTFLPPAAQMPVMAIVGVVLLIIVLTQLIPEVGNYRLFR